MLINKLSSLRSFVFLTLSLFSVSALRCSPLGNNDDASESPVNKTLLQFNQDTAKKDLKVLTASAHSMGSARQILVRDHILNRLKEAGIAAQVQSFIADTPNPVLFSNPSSPAPQTLTKEGHNIMAMAVQGSSPCIVLIGSHYDSKHLDSGEYLGANDSASSTIGLLQILISLKTQATTLPAIRCAIGAYFFDGEEPFLPEWNDGTRKHSSKIEDHLYGSRHGADHLIRCDDGLCLPEQLGGYSLKGLILLDMIGSPSVQLTMDQNSDKSLIQAAIALDKSLFSVSVIHPHNTHAIEDDHIPFINRGVAAIDLIDFYHLEHWHKITDGPETISLESIEKVSLLAANLALDIAK